MLSKYSKINLSRYCTLRQLPTNELEGVLQNGESTLYISEDGSLCIISKDNDNVTIQRLLNQINNVKIPEFNLPEFVDEYTAYALSAVKNGNGYDLAWAKIPTSLEYNYSLGSLPPVTPLTKYRTIETDNLQKINITNQSLLNTLNSYDLDVLLNEDESTLHKNTSGDFSLSEKTLMGITTNIFKNNLINDITPPSFPSTQLTGNNVYCLSAKTISGSTTMDWLLVNAKLNYNTGNTISINEIVDIVDISKTKINLSRQTNLNISSLTNEDIIEILKKRNDYTEFILHKSNDELILSNKIYGNDLSGEYYTINNIKVSNDKIYGKNIPGFENGTEEDYILAFVRTGVDIFGSNTLDAWVLTWIPATPKLSYNFDFPNNTVSGGTIDNTFNIVSGFSSSVTTPYVTTITLQPDGKILVGGEFDTYSGVTRNYIVRLNTGGTIDNTFNIGGGFDAETRIITLQPDGKILVGGAFTSYSGVTRNRIVRLNSDGTIDNTFTIGSGFNNFLLFAITLQPDGKILVGGEFDTYSGVTRNYIVRLNSNGTIDNTFNIGSGFNGFVYPITLQPDGKILVGGGFTSYSGVTRNCMVRLNSDGTIDNTFNIGTGFANPGYLPSLTAITLQPDGKILVGGFFNTYNNAICNRIIRLNSNGSIDNTFNSNLLFGSSNFVYVITQQRDGKILVGRDGSNNNIIRLNNNGTTDNSFNVGTMSGFILSITLQPDGKILTGGGFTSYSGVTSNNIIRLNNNKTATLNIFVNNNLVETRSITGGGSVNISNGDFFYSEITLGSYLSTAELDMIIDGNTTPYAEEIFITNPTGVTTSSIFTAENSRRYYIDAKAT
jgi:uncharacterized delta-60 repeat protein